MDPEPELIYAHPFGGSQDPCLLYRWYNSLYHYDGLLLNLRDFQI